MESAYAPRATPGSKRATRKESPLSHGFEPFAWDPPNPDLGGGAWIAPTPHPAEGGVVDITDGPLAAKSRGQSPASFTKNLMLLTRDKESLLEEIIQLKRMLIDQAFYLKRDKVHALSVQIENKKLENDIKDMEMQASMAVKTSGSTRVRLKLQGMKTRYENLQNVCDQQHEEITFLRRDVRTSHAREMEMERDFFVEEIAKLHKDVKKLKTLHSQLSSENKDLCRIRDKACDMEVLNYHLENCMQLVLKALDKANRDILSHKQKLTESSLLSKRNAKKSKDLEDQIALTRNCLEKERLEKKSLDEKRVCLEEELVKVEEKLKAKGVHVQASTPSPDKLPGSKSNTPRSTRTV